MTQPPTSSRRERRSQSRFGRRHFITAAVIVIVVATAAAVFALGGGDKEVAHRRVAPSTSTTTTTMPIPTAPLTGLPDTDGKANSRSALLVKIENTPEARPQSGLDLADVVYEEVVEGGITRFWAIFNSAAPENIGPIRSVRAMDPGVIDGYGGVVAYSGGTSANVDLIRRKAKVWVDENNAGDAFFREPSRPAPHNLFGRSELLFQRGGQPVPPEPPFVYVEEGQSFTGESIASFHANFKSGYDVTYKWDAAKEGWARYSNTAEPFMSVGSSLIPVHVAPENVVVMFIAYNEHNEGLMYGTGQAWVFSNGQLIRGTWARSYPGDPPAFYDANGKQIQFTPGRTWIELLPTGLTVDVVPGAPTTLPPATTTTTHAKKGKK
jgi:hypothetical protein